MLLTFSVANFRSFKDRQTLSLEATKDSALPSNVITANGEKALKTVAVYGANASGKTNLLKAIFFMRDFVLKSTNNQKGDKIQISSFALDVDSINNPSFFEIEFISDNIRYQYGFKINTSQIIEEWLYAYPNNRKQKWFSRCFDEKSKQYQWYFGSKLQGPVQAWKEQTLENTLFLSRATQLNFQQLDPIFLWFKNLVILPLETKPFDTAEFCFYSKLNKQKVLNFLKIADDSILDVRIEKKDIYHEGEAKFIHKVANSKKLTELDLREESAGTITLFSLASYWLEVLQYGKLLIIDELNSHLHPLLAKFLIKSFNDKELNKNGAQLVFTCHDTFLLDTKVLRRDQIWFTEANAQRASELFSLSEFGPRKEEAIEKGYLKGRYGAIPFVDESILS